jgi:polysaccharide biosynthesis transport protein
MASELEIKSIAQPATLGDRAEAQGQMAPPLILQYWQILLRWKWIILGLMVASVVVGLVANFLATPQYTATTRIEIAQSQANVTQIEGVKQAESETALQFYNTQYSLLGSRSVAERVSRALSLPQNDAFFDAHNANPSAQAGLVEVRVRAQKQADKPSRERIVLLLLQKNISISPLRGSSLVDISYTSASPQLSAKIANMWAQQYVESRIAQRFDSTAVGTAYLEGKLAELKAKLETSERDVVNYASQKGIVAINKSTGVDGKTQVQTTLAAADLEALNSMLARAKADRISAESRRQYSASGSNSESLGNVAISSLRQRRAEVASEYAKMMVQFEPGYPAARALKEQVDNLDASIAREVSRVQSSRSSEFNEAVQRENALQQRVNSLRSTLDTQQRDSIQYNIFQREADTNRELYDSMLQRYKQIGVAGIGTNNISVIDTAKVPERPSSPRLIINLALSILAGLALSAAAAFILEQIDEGLRDPTQVNRLLHLPLLGSTPDINDNDSLAMLRDAKSELSEAYLSVQSNLAFSTDHGVPRSFMVTSTRPAEGKSTSSLAIATVLGRTGKKVLLIDGDMRSPSIHSNLNMDNTQGLSNFLAGENDWQRLVQPTGQKGLSILPSGPLPPSAAELLSSDRMLMLIGALGAHYDHVVVDAPPVLGLADAPLLSRAVEGCIFVIEAEGVAVRGLKASIGRLQSVNAHLFGAILTKLRNQQSGYGYGYGYGYSYGANDDVKAKA